MSCGQSRQNRHPRRALLALGLALCCATAPWTAQAQDSAAAEALFQSGLADLKKQRFDTACPALAESYRLDARPGTLFTLAECEAQAGKVASAIAHYSDYVQLYARMPPDQRLRQGDRDSIAQAQITKLQPLVPHLVLILPSDAPRGTLVRRGDVLLQGPSLGIPLPVDPGEHVITTQAPGGQLRTIRVSVAAGETKRVELAVDLPAVNSATPVLSGSPPMAPAAPATPAPVMAMPGRTSSQRVWAYVLGGVGLEGLAVGAVAGVLAWDKKSTINRECQGKVCTQEGKDAGDSAKNLGVLSTVTMGIGLGALAGAALLMLTEPSASRESGAPAPRAPQSRGKVQPWIAGQGPLGSMVGLRGTF